MLNNLVSMDNIGGGNAAARFKMRKDERYRLSFVLLPGILEGEPSFASSPMFATGRRFYIEGVGYVVDEGPQSEIAGVPSKEYFATVVALWPLKKGTDGFEASKGAIAEGEYELKYWLMSKKTVEDVKKQYAMRSAKIQTSDLGIICEDDKFQKAVYGAMEDSVFHKLSTAKSTREVYEGMLDKIRGMQDGLTDIFGMRLSPDELRMRINRAAAGAGAGGSNGTADFGSVAVPPGVRTSSAADILDEF
jgi:hypothetical protein